MNSKRKPPISFSHNVELVVDRALEHLDLRPDLHEQIKSCNTIVQVQFPVKLDDGEYHVFKGWRKQVDAPANRPSWMPAKVWKSGVKKQGVEHLK